MASERDVEQIDRVIRELEQELRRQTALLERIADAIDPEIRTRPKKDDDHV